MKHHDSHGHPDTGRSSRTPGDAARRRGRMHAGRARAPRLVAGERVRMLAIWRMSRCDPPDRIA